MLVPLADSLLEPPEELDVVAEAVAVVELDELEELLELDDPDEPEELAATGAGADTIVGATLTEPIGVLLVAEVVTGLESLTVVDPVLVVGVVTTAGAGADTVAVVVVVVVDAELVADATAFCCNCLAYATAYPVQLVLLNGFVVHASGITIRLAFMFEIDDPAP